MCHTCTLSNGKFAHSIQLLFKKTDSFCKDSYSDYYFLNVEVDRFCEVADGFVEVFDTFKDFDFREAFLVVFVDFTDDFDPFIDFFVDF